MLSQIKSGICGVFAFNWKKTKKKTQLDQDLDWNDKGPSQNFTSNNMRFSDDFGGIEVN